MSGAGSSSEPAQQLERRGSQQERSSAALVRRARDYAAPNLLVRAERDNLLKAAATGLSLQGDQHASGFKGLRSLSRQNLGARQSPVTRFHNHSAKKLRWRAARRGLDLDIKLRGFCLLGLEGTCLQMKTGPRPSDMVKR
jgi:hypothetical protein